MVRPRLASSRREAVRSLAAGGGDRLRSRVVACGAVLRRWPNPPGVELRTVEARVSRRSGRGEEGTCAKRHRSLSQEAVEKR